MGRDLSEKTPEQLKAEIQAIETDMQKERDAAVAPFKAAWSVSSGLVKMTWAIVKIPLGIVWAMAKWGAEDKRKTREKIRAKHNKAHAEAIARAEKLAELKKQLKEATK